MRAGAPGVAVLGVALEGEPQLAVLGGDEAVRAALPAQLPGDLLLLEALGVSR